MKGSVYFLIGLILSSVLLLGCNTEADRSYPDPKALRENPLTAEQIADGMIDYLSLLQIRANEAGEPITDLKLLRAIDETFIDARNLQSQALDEQDNGKKGGAYGVNGNFAAGEVLHTDGALYFGYEFEISPAPGMQVILATHVAPHAVAELFSGATLNLGNLKSLYGAQMYEVPKLSDDEWNRYRTVVFYSGPFDQVIAIAQIRGAVRK